MQAFDANVASGRADIGDIQNGKGEFFNDLLATRFKSITVVAFDQQVFRGAQVDALLLLASDDEPRGLRVVRTTDVGTLTEVDLADGLVQVVPAGRWSAAFSASGLDASAAVSASSRMVRLGTLARGRRTCCKRSAWASSRRTSTHWPSR